MNDGTVCVGYLHPWEVAASFHLSIVGLFVWDLHNNARILGGGAHAASFASSGRIPEGRNELVGLFLDGPAEWLWMVDADMAFAPDTVERLIASADPIERPVMGGLCFGQRIEDIDPHTHMAELVSFPTVYDYREIEGVRGFLPREDYKRDAVIRCAGTGAACLLIHRTALERVGPDPFTPIAANGSHLGEDLSFCVRLANADIPLHIDTAVRIGHQKTAFLTERSTA